ncbi:MAG: hypothetical protein CK517_02190 [Flavobacteriales bacterium]|nr:MAG: hypothetical protein CK517_02190 [Flavobacteriales bacterium]
MKKTLSKMQINFKKLLLIIIGSSFVVAIGTLFKIMHCPGATFIISFGLVLEVIFGAMILIYLLKNK